MTPDALIPALSALQDRGWPLTRRLDGNLETYFALRLERGNHYDYYPAVPTAPWVLEGWLRWRLGVWGYRREVEYAGDWAEVRIIDRHITRAETVSTSELEALITCCLALPEDPHAR